MSPETESFVYDSQGPVHTGTGSQFNITFALDARQRLVSVGEPRAIAREHLRWLDPLFVEPAHYGRARELLADKGSVLLTGAPGSGRRATAQMLLHRLPDAEGLIRELPDTDPSGEQWLDSSAVDTGERLLLDLSISEDSEENSTVLRQLPSYRSVVHQQGAFLVVVLPSGWTRHLGAELGPLDVEIGRPDGTRVFQQYMHCEGIEVSKEQLDAKVTVQLGSMPLREVAELAGLVQLARKSKPAHAFPDWLSEALAALTEWSGEVEKQSEKLSSGQQRALLLTTAMFSGAHADAVSAATSALLKVVGHPENDLPFLERMGLGEQLTEIAATRDDAGRVRFTRLAYDRAVRTYFWTNFPDLRVRFRSWVGTTISQQTLTSADRDEVVTAFAEQALRTDRPGDLRHLAESWAQRTDLRWPSRLLPQAAKAVERGLADERHGRFFRRQLYNWSRDPRLEPDLTQVVVQVCSEVLALAYPDQAVVRLHHIFRRHSGVAAATAGDALLNLARERRLYVLLLSRLTRDSRAEEYMVPDTGLFLELADPVQLTDRKNQGPPLIEDGTVQAQLVSGWRVALVAPSQQCADRVRDWLAACEDGRFRELLLDVLVGAGGGRSDVLSHLHVIARDWAHASDEHGAERARVTAHLDHKILGIDLIEEIAS